MEIEKVMSRVRKLLQLSRSTNEAEAALAAQRAAELMAEHNLTEAVMRVQGGDVQPAEPIVTGWAVGTPDGRPQFEGRKRVAWKGSIASAVAHSFGCKSYWWGPNTCLFGRQSAVQAAEYTTAYLCAEVDRLADAAWEASEQNYEGGGWARSWKGSFRLGAASAIAGRLREAKHAERMARRQAAQDAAQDVPEGVPVNPQALALVERDAAEVDTAYSDHSKDWKGGGYGAIGRISSGGAYQAGKSAGGHLHLGGGRAGLGAGSKRLPGSGR
jgi:hypothetical protein